MAMELELELPAVEPQSLKKLSFKTLKRSLHLFSSLHSHLPPSDPESKKIRLSHKLNSENTFSKSIQQSALTSSTPSKSNAVDLPGTLNPRVGIQSDVAIVPILPVQPKGQTDYSSATRSNAVVPSFHPKSRFDYNSASRSNAIVPNHGSFERNRSSRWPKPAWHRPWKNYRVISGHLGWVRSIAFDPSNNWFCTGSADRTIKIWDIASGNLKLTLTGHIQQVRALAVSARHTYMFSAGDDKLVKCWDLEQNKVIRSYHGHLSGVYCLSLHPTLDVLFTGGNDSVCRVWDVRTKTQIHVLSHHEAVFSVFARAMDPQVVTGSHDSTIKLWDLRNGKSMSTLTHHKKSVRAMALHPSENCFASASSDSTKKFGLPRGEFVQNMMCQSERKSIINAMAVNEEGVVATGGDDGSLWFCDWKSGWSFQQDRTVAQPGSLESEAGIYALSYDMTGTRLVSCEADKTIKMWKEDENATPETHPLSFKPPRGFRRF